MKNLANRKDIILKYKIYKAIKQNKKISEIARVFKVSTKTVLDIKKNGFYKIDKILVIINSIREKNPSFTLNQIKEYIKEHYNLNISLSAIYYKTKKEIDKKLFELLKILINDNEIEYAVNILKQFLFISWEYLEILENIEDKFLNYSLLADKYYYLLYNGKLELSDKTLDKIENIMKLCKENELNYSYYKWLNLKMRVLQAIGKYDEILKAYNYNEIIKLPFNIKSYIFAVVSSVGIRLNNKQAIDTINFFRRRFKSERNRKGNIGKDYRIFLRNSFASLGKIKLAISYDNEPFLNFWLGNYKKIFKISKNLSIEMKLPLEISLALCYLFSKDLFSFIKIIDKIKSELKGFPTYNDDLIMALALREVISNRYENARELLSKSNTRTLKAVLNKNYKELGKYRKIELLLKYILKGNIKKSVEIAKRYGCITHLRIYSLLTKKSAKTLGKYNELKVVSYILRNRAKFIKFYFLRKKPIIKIDNKLIISSGRENDLFSLLYFLALEKPISKYANIYELERNGFKNPKIKAYNINRKLGYKAIFVSGDNIYLNANVWTDIDEYLKTKNNKLLKIYPFDRLSFRYRWADYYRDLIILSENS